MRNRKNDSTFIAPERLYPLAGFEEVSGISATRRFKAAKEGVKLTTLEVGRRKFVRGSDGIQYIERLAELSKDGDSPSKKGGPPSG